MSEDDRALYRLSYSEPYLSETRNEAKAVWRGENQKADHGTKHVK